MITVTELPNLKIYRQRVQLPQDQYAPTMYGITFLCTPNLDSSIDMMRNPLLVTHHKWLTYYIEGKYLEKFGNKTFRLNYLKRRQEIYQTIQDKYSLMRRPINFEMVQNRNVYYDMHIQNELFFNNQPRISLLKKIRNYFNYLKKIINNSQFDKYRTKTILIDAVAWQGVKCDKVNNPLMYLFMAFKRWYGEIESLGNINFIIVGNNEIMRLNPSECDKKSFSNFRMQMARIFKKIDLNNDEAIDTEIKKDEIKEDVKFSLDSNEDKFGFTGDDADEEDVELKNAINDAIGAKIDKEAEEEIPNNLDDKEVEVTKKDIENVLSKKVAEDEELVKAVATIVKDNITGKSTASLKRDEELRQKQREIKFKGMTLDEIHKLTEKKDRGKIPSINISTKVKTTNDNVKVIRPNMAKAYNDQLMARDTMNILENLNNMSIPTYIKSVDVEDTSDELTYKETYTVKLEDENRIRHSFKVDMPKFIDGDFLLVNGALKTINKQLFMKPVVKTSPDNVQIVTNYNKIFIYRYGGKISSKVEKLRRSLINPIQGVRVSIGDNTFANNTFKTTLEYDELAKHFNSISGKGFEFIFNQEEVKKRLGDKKLKSNQFCIGFANKDPIIMDYDSEKIGDKRLIDFIVSSLGNKFKEEYDNTTPGGKRFAYNRAKIMGKYVPIILLLGYCEGLSTVLKKANVKHYFSDKRVSSNDDQGVIQFADGYLVYDRYPLENSLLLNALDLIPSRVFTYDQMDEKETYIELFDVMLGSRIIGNAFNSFYEFMIDPITKEILDDLDYPQDFVSLVLFASSLLADNSYMKEIDMNLYRIRSNEVVNAMLHRAVADAYSKYRATANNKNPVKISIPQNVIMKQLGELQTVEGVSVLNPIYELDKTRTVSTKGLQGLNLEEAYTEEKRNYHPTMAGIIGISSPPGGSIGINRKLTLEPNIKNARGYIDIKDNPGDKDLKDVNLFTAAEALTPLGAFNDDSTRTAMASSQSGHIIPVHKSSPVLISNGAEQVIQYYLSDNFAVTAKDDGKVVDYDEKAGIYMIEYKDGSYQAIDINPKTVKNSSSGFFLENKLKCDLKVGQKVHKNDILATEEKFFSEDSLNGNRFNIGSLQKVAIMSCYATFEDSTFVTKKMSEDMSSDIAMMKDVIIGKNANVDHIVKIGDHIDIGDVLVSFETSYDEKGLNKFLSSVGDELQEDIKSMGKTPIKSKYPGVVSDIRIYSSVDLDELSPSLRKIVSGYYNRVNAKKKAIEKYDKSPGIYKAGVILNEPTSKIVPGPDGKIKGREVFDGVLIEFYIKHDDVLGVGDKVTFFSALKATVGEVIDEGLEPYSEFRPDEEISTFLGPISILARMTPSIMMTLFGNKVIVELKRKLEEIYTET